MAEPREAAEDLGSYDYIVVGAGSAGCVLANRLSADPASRVLLLEAGGKDDHRWLRIPVGFTRMIGNPLSDWNLMTEPEPHMGNQPMAFPRGRVLGGSSSINGMIYTRGHARDYDSWRQMGNEGWGWDDVLPYFRKAEDSHRGASATHGAGGPLRVEAQRYNWDFLEPIRDAAAEIGIPRTDDFNGGETEGSGYYDATQKRGSRWSAASAYLRPALDRPNLRVLTGAQASGLILDGRRATGLRFVHEGRACLAHAGAEVILSTGVVQSPQLLELSGIGDPAVLADAGIAPVHALKGVGANLHDHWQLRIIYRLENCRTMNQRMTPLGKAAMAVEYALFKTGPLTMAPAKLGIYAKSDPARDIPDLQYHIVTYSADTVGGTPHAFPGITVSVCFLHPQSRGTIHVRSADPAVPPAIKVNYFAAETDRLTAIAGVQQARRLMAARALERYRPVEILPGPELTTDAEIMEGALKVATSIYHPVGTCRMGADPMAVVDARLRVHGIDGLRVVDASVMPTVTSGNTNAPTIMIGEKAADMILADRRALSRAA